MPAVARARFGDRLRTLRHSQGLTMASLAEALGTTRQSISHWELGHSEPSLDKLERIALYFRVSLDWLIAGQTRSGQRPER